MHAPCKPSNPASFQPCAFILSLFLEHAFLCVVVTYRCLPYMRPIPAQLTHPASTSTEAHWFPQHTDCLAWPPPIRNIFHGFSFFITTSQVSARVPARAFHSQLPCSCHTAELLPIVNWRSARELVAALTALDEEHPILQLHLMSCMGNAKIDPRINQEKLSEARRLIINMSCVLRTNKVNEDFCRNPTGSILDFDIHSLRVHKT